MMLDIITGIIAIVIILLIVSYMFFILIKNRNSNIKKTIIIFALLCFSLTVLAYQLVPTKDMDLFRYYEMLETLKGKTLQETFSDFQYNKTPITAVWFWVVAKSGCYNLINTVPAFITILCFGYMLIDSIKTKNNRLCDVSLSILFVLGFVNIVVILTTVRYPLAISLVSLGMYLEIYKGKKVKDVAWLYLLGFLIHDAIILSLIVYFAYRIFGDKKILKIAILLFGVFLTLLQQILSIVEMGDLGNRIFYYLQPSYYDERRATANLLFIIVISIIYMIVKRYKNFCEFGRNEEKNQLLQYYLLYVVGLSICPQLLDRLIIPVVMLFFPVILDYFRLLVEIPYFKYQRIKSQMLYNIAIFVFCVGAIFMWTYQIATIRAWSLNWL